MKPEPKIGIIVVAYNAVTTLASVLDRIPESFRPRISEIFVLDDSSSDSTFLVGLGYKVVAPEMPISVLRNHVNLGYGGNQKRGYRMAIEHDLDIVVLLHGDGQYAPECLPDIVAPLERGECDAVMGSRMLMPGAARRGGMPLYKYLGNRILTRAQNALLKTSLSEFHSGYRAYSVEALRDLSFEDNSDGFNFDTQIIIQLVDKGKRIVEVPIPTYYGDEICYVNGMKYAKDVMVDVLRYRMRRASADQLAVRAHLTGQPPVEREYTLKESVHGSHRRMLAMLRELPPSRILDLGCSSGLLAAEAQQLGHQVTGVDRAAFPEAQQRMHRFISADLDSGLPATIDERYDVVIAADVLEHLRFPEVVLGQLIDRVTPNGMIIASVPNFGHWYPRARVVTGMFDYDDQGILDRGHVRFFTRKSFERLVNNAGLSARLLTVTGVPFERLTDDMSTGMRVLSRLDRYLARTWPGLWAYQFIFELRPRVAVLPAGDSVASPIERQAPSTSGVD